MDTEPVIIPKEVVLTGNFVQLRSPITEETDELVQTMFSDSIIMEFLPQLWKENGWTKEDTVQRREQLSQFQKEGKALPFSVLDLESNTLAGSCGIHRISAEFSTGDAGIVLLSKFWGTKVATEAFVLMLDFAFDKIPLKTVTSGTNEHNARMRGFYHKYGIPFRGVDVNSGFEWYRYEVVKEDWPRVKSLMQQRLDKP